jgi:L-ribulose-5-phosphate 4-epimerase
MTQDHRSDSFAARGFEPTAEKLLPDLSLPEEMALLARALWREGYDDSITGHLTVNLHDGTLLCNPWLLRWSELRGHQMIRIDHEGRLIEGDFPVPPGIPLHLQLHQLRPGIEVAVHGHPRFGTIWADRQEIPEPMDQSSAAGGGRLTLVNEYGGGVNDTLTARRTAELMGDADLALLAGHGVMVLGDSISTVYHRAYSLELRCRNAWRVRAAGPPVPSPLSAEIQAQWEARETGLHGLWQGAARAELVADPTFL